MNRRDPLAVPMPATRNPSLLRQGYVGQALMLRAGMGTLPTACACSPRSSGSLLTAHCSLLAVHCVPPASPMLDGVHG